MSPADLQLACRRIFLRDFRAKVSIGVHAFELSAAQTIIFNVELFVPLERCTPREDDLAEVLDYDFVREAIFNRVRKGHIALQETLCDDILAAMLAHPKVLAARVSTAKPDVYPDCAAVGVEVFGSKPAAAIP